MDLLEGVGAHGLICEHSYSLNDLSLDLTWTSPSSSSQEASRFKTDAETGRVIIDGDNSDEDVPQKSKLKPEYMDDNLSKEGLTSVHGFTRGPNGKVKSLVDTFVARGGHRCQEERHGTICIHFTWTSGKKRARNGGAGAPKICITGRG